MAVAAVALLQRLQQVRAEMVQFLEAVVEAAVPA